MNRDITYASFLDNFDPQQLAVTPRVLGLEVDDWKAAEVNTPQVAIKVCSYWMSLYIAECFPL